MNGRPESDSPPGRAPSGDAATAAGDGKNHHHPSSAATRKTVTSQADGPPEGREQTLGACPYVLVS